MRSRVLVLFFTLACVAWGAKFVAVLFRLAFDLSPASFWTTFWAGGLICYLMLVLSMIFECRYFGRRSRPARLVAYGLLLFSNSFVPIRLPPEYLGFSVLSAPGEVFPMAFFPVFLAHRLLPLVSWAIVTVLCIFGKGSSEVPGRLLPAGFAVLGSMDHWLFMMAMWFSV